MKLENVDQNVLLWSSPKQKTLSGAKVLIDNQWQSLPKFTPPHPFLLDSSQKINNAYVLDVDCDGYPELAYNFTKLDGTHVQQLYRVSDNGWKAELNPQFLLNLNPIPHSAAIKFKDINNDGCQDVLVGYKSNEEVVHRVYIADKFGWKEKQYQEFSNVFFWTGKPGTQGRLIAEIDDLTGDGIPEIFWNTRNGENNDKGAYILKPDGWVFDNNLVPPEPLPHLAKERETKFAVTKLEGGSAKSQLAYFNKERPPNIYSFKYGKWALDTNLTPKETIAQFDKADIGVRFPDLNGDGYADIAYTKKMKDGSLIKKAYRFQPGLKEPWISDVRYYFPRPTFSEDYKDTGVFIVDFNGDGINDLLYAQKNSSGESVREGWVNCSLMPECRNQVPTHKESGYWINVSSEEGIRLFKDRYSGYVPPIDFSQESVGSLGVRALDINGDGLTDLVISREEDNPITALPTMVQKIFINKIEKNSSGQKIGGWYELKKDNLLPPIPFTRPIRKEIGEKENEITKVRDNRIELIDIDGDRLPDLIYKFVTAIPKPESDEDRGNRVKKGIPLEFKEVILSGAYLNREDHWVETQAYTPPYRIDSDDKNFELSNSATQISLQDLNADGLLDLVYAERCVGECAIDRQNPINATFLNTGNGWIENSAYNIPLEALLKNTKGDQGYRLMDVNADGLQDVIYHRIIEGDVHEKGAYLNTGLGWTKADDSYSPPIAFVEVYRGDLGIRPLDLNGDSIVDLVQSYRRGDSESLTSVWINEPFQNKETPFKADLLSNVTDGLNRRSSLEYKSYIGTAFNQNSGQIAAKVDSNVDRNPEYPVLDPPMPGYVVTNLEVNGPSLKSRNSKYSYSGYRVNVNTGNSLGFAVQKISDKERKRVTEIHYLQSDGLVGNVSKTIVTQMLSNKQEVVISDSDSVFYVDKTVGTRLSNEYQPEILRVHLDLTKSNSRDLFGILLSSQVDSFKYDENGNPAIIKTLFADGSGSETINQYKDNLKDWHLARLTESSVTQFSPGRSSQTRRANFAYSPITGQLIKETSLAGTPFESVIDYDRDVFGNKVVSITSVKTGEAARTSRVKYDAKGRFPLTSANNLGHTSHAEFDEVSGAITSKIDPNGMRQIVHYDSLQRVIKEIDVTGVTTVTKTEFSNNGEWAFKVTKQVGTLPPTVSAHDAAGRPRWETSTGFEGKPVIMEYEYDALGRLDRSSTPRFKGEQARFTVRRYDELDRQVVEHRPDGSILSTRYEGLRSVAIDPLKRESVIQRDVRGRTWFTLDPLKGRTEFEFDASGKATRIINALGQSSMAEYNLAGQRIALNDPSLGRWSYKYNGYGELIQQTDARGEVITLKYDGIGRLVERSSRSGIAKYEFDKGQNAIGRLSMVKSSQGASRDIKYDAYGRIQFVDLQVGTDRSSIEQEYDELSRPILRKYSSGFSITNYYDENGFWRKVFTSETSQFIPAWESLNVDALGRVTKERLGNGVVNTLGFDVDSGRLVTSSSRSVNGTSIQDFTLDYDLVGNILQRLDRANKKTERFEYDTLNRITSATKLMGEHVTVSYDPLGNILQKSNTGTYQYCDNERTRTLCGLQDTSGSKSTFTYDASGNMVKLGEKRLVYDAEGRVTSISEGLRNQSSFRYGADGELISQQSRSGETRFEVTYLGDSEIVREAFASPFNPTPERTRVRHFISAPTGTLGFFEITYWHFPFRHATPMYNMLVMDNPLRSSEMSKGVTYFVKDQLGSLRATLNERGDVIESFDYDAWGKRRQSDNKAYYSLRQGFSGHEHLDNLDLVHMGGRVYSPSLARFVSPDPFVQFAGYSQSHNRYSYVLNNPIRFIDASGFNIFDDIGRAVGGAINAVGEAIGDVIDATIGKPMQWVGEQLNKAGAWLQQNWRTVAVIAATVALGPAGLAVFGGGLLGAVATGAAIGGLSAALYGGGPSEIVQGALMGGITAAAFYGAGSFANSYKLGNVGRSMAHGFVGGLTSVARNGKFEQGFASAFAGNYLTPGTDQLKGGYGVAAAAVVGGVTAQISGDSFENGATSAAFGRLFNHLAHLEFGVGKYDEKNILDVSVGIDGTVGDSFGKVSCSMSDKTCSGGTGFGPFSVNIGAEGVESMGLGASLGLGKFRFAEININILNGQERYDVGLSARVMNLGVNADVGVRSGAGLWRAYGDLDRNITNWISRGTGY